MANRNTFCSKLTRTTKKATGSCPTEEAQAFKWMAEPPQGSSILQKQLGMGDMYNRPFDSASQSNTYNRKVKINEEEKEKCNTFYYNPLPKSKCRPRTKRRH
jgi:hypothetical protein